MKESTKQFRVIGKQEVAEAKAQGEEVSEDKYLEKVKKYIPTEVVLAYVFLQQTIQNGAPEPGSFWTKEVLLGLIFFICLIATPVYKFIQSNEEGYSKPIRQLIISTLAYIAWIFYFGDWFKFLMGETYYSDILATIVMVTFTLLAPILEFIIPSSKVISTPSSSTTKS